MAKAAKKKKAAKTRNPQTMTPSAGSTKPKNKKSARKSGGFRNGFRGRAA